MSFQVDQVVQCMTTLKEMLHDRGEECSLLESMSHSEVEAMMKESPVLLLEVNPQHTILFYLLPNFKIAKIREMLQDEHIPENMIIVTKETLTSMHVKGLDQEFENTHIQCFTLKELQINITKHVLVPKHELIKDAEQIQTILQAHHVKSRAQLPFILKTDAMAKYLDARPGMLVKITRVSPSSGEYTCYRCCV